MFLFIECYTFIINDFISLNIIFTMIVTMTLEFCILVELSTIVTFLHHHIQGCLATAAILSVEMFPTEQRTFALNAIEFFWCLGYISLTPLAYYIRNWRWLQLAVSLPLAATVLFYWWGIVMFIPLSL